MLGIGDDPLVDQVRKLSGRYDWVILDGPPGISNTSADAVRVSDVVLIPAKASAFDVWAATDIVAAVKARQQSSKGLPKAAFVITMAKPRTPPRPADRRRPRRTRVASAEQQDLRPGGLHPCRQRRNLGDRRPRQDGTR